MVDAWTSPEARLLRAKDHLTAAFNDLEAVAGSLNGEMHSAGLVLRSDLARLIRQTHNLALMVGVPPSDLRASST